MELLAHRLLVQHAEHRVFAVNGGHDRDAEVDLAPFVADSEASVLGDAVLGDIELRHHLDSGDDRLVPIL